MFFKEEAMKTEGKDKPKDVQMQRDIALRANRSMVLLNIHLRRCGQRPIGRHLDLRPDEDIREMAHMR